MRSRLSQIETLAGLSLVLLVLALPFGTRYLWLTGEIAGVPVEWGTVSLYGSQIMAVAVIALGALAARRGRGGDSEKGLAARGGQATASEKRIVALALLFAGLTVMSALLATLDFQALPLLAAGWTVIGALLLAAITYWRPPQRLFAVAWFVGAVVQGGLAFWQMLTQTVTPSKWLGLASQQAAELGVFVVETADGRWLRAYGSFGHPNILGLFLVIGLLFGLSLLVERPAGRRRVLVWLGLPLIGIGLLAAFSRAAFLAAAIAGLVVLLTQLALRRPDWFRRSLTALAVAIAGFSVLATLLPDLLGSRVLGTGRLEVQSVSQRLSLTDDAWRLFRERPILGVGPGQMPAAAFRYLSDGRLGYDYQPVHNLPLLVAVETGLLGLLAWLGLLVGLAAHLLKGLRRTARPAPPGAAWLTIAAGLAAAGAIAALFDHFLWSLWPGQLMFWLLAAFLALSGRPGKAA